MSTNLFQKLSQLVPDAPLLVGRVIAHHDDDTSTVELPVNLALTPVGGPVARGALIRPRGRTVPIGGWAFVRRGVIETRAPDNVPQAVSVGVEAGPPAPPGTTALWARFNAGGNRDDAGNWMYDLDNSPNYTVESGGGAPGSVAGHIQNFDRSSIFIQHVDNETGGTSNLFDDSQYLSSRDWLYTIQFKPEASSNNVHLGGFNSTGQRVFSLSYGISPQFIEARIDDAAGAWYLFVETPLTIDEWNGIALRKTGNLFELLVNGSVVASDSTSYSGNLVGPSPLISFTLIRSGNGNRTGFIDEVRFSYVP